MNNHSVFDPITVAVATPEWLETGYEESGTGHRLDLQGNAIFLSKSVVQNDLLLPTAIQRQEYSFFGECSLVTGAGDERFDQFGVIRIGQRVKRGDVLLTFKGYPDQPPDEVLMGTAPVLKPITKLWNFDCEGVVTHAHVTTDNDWRCDTCNHPLGSARPSASNDTERCPHCRVHRGLYSSHLKQLPSDLSARVIIEVLIRRPIAPGDLLQDDSGASYVVARLLDQMPNFDCEDKSERTLDAVVLQGAFHNVQQTIQGRLWWRRRQSTGYGRSKSTIGKISLKRATVTPDDVRRSRSVGRYLESTELPVRRDDYPGGHHREGETLDEALLSKLYRLGFNHNLQEILLLRSDALAFRGHGYIDDRTCRLPAEEAYDSAERFWAHALSCAERLRLDNVRGIAAKLPFRLTAPTAVVHLIWLIRALGFDVKCLAGSSKSYKMEDINEPHGINAGAITHLQFCWATDDQRRNWSCGTVTDEKPFGHRGISSSAIFGSANVLRCRCGKHRGKKEEGSTCERCGVVVDYPYVRHFRSGIVELCSPMIHPLIWRRLSGHRLHHRAAEHGEFPTECERLGIPLSELSFSTVLIPPVNTRPEWNCGLNVQYERLVERALRYRKMCDLNAPKYSVQTQAAILQKCVNDLMEDAEGNETGGSLLQEIQCCLRRMVNKRCDFTCSGVVVPDGRLSDDVVAVSPFLYFDLAGPLIVAVAKYISEESVLNCDIERLSDSEVAEVFSVLQDRFFAAQYVLAVGPTGEVRPMQLICVDDSVIAPIRMHPTAISGLKIPVGSGRVTVFFALTSEANSELAETRHGAERAEAHSIVNLSPQRLVDCCVERLRLPLSDLDRIVLGLPISRD